jgi:hypothetical protein
MQFNEGGPVTDEGAASNTHAASQLSPHAFGFRAPINDLMVDACANDESDERATRAQGQTRAARVGGGRGGRDCGTRCGLLLGPRLTGLAQPRVREQILRVHPRAVEHHHLSKPRYVAT